MHESTQQNTSTLFFLANVHEIHSQAIWLSLTVRLPCCLQAAALARKELHGNEDIVPQTAGTDKVLNTVECNIAETNPAEITAGGQEEDKVKDDQQNVSRNEIEEENQQNVSGNDIEVEEWAPWVHIRLGLCLILCSPMSSRGSRPRTPPLALLYTWPPDPCMPPPHAPLPTPVRPLTNHSSSFHCTMPGPIRSPARGDGTWHQA